MVAIYCTSYIHFVNFFWLLIRYDYYSFNVIPVVGELVAGDRDSYQYLVESVRRFPPQVCFVVWLTNILMLTCNLKENKRKNILMSRQFKVWCTFVGGVCFDDCGCRISECGVWESCRRGGGDPFWVEFLKASRLSIMFYCRLIRWSFWRFSFNLYVTWCVHES